jgi:hypothetical protein
LHCPNLKDFFGRKEKTCPTAGGRVILWTENMGCLKLTYHPEPTLFLEEQAKEKELLTWRVWSRKETDFLGVEEGEQTQNGPPTIFVNMYATPKGFGVDEYLTGLRSALIANGFSNDLVVEPSSISGSIKAWWNSSPTATVTIKNFRLGQDRLEAGGYATLNDPHSIIIYNGLSPTGANSSVAMWKYINATVHEIGHGIFGFDHDSSGMTNDASSIMDYRSAWTRGAGFSGAQQVVIMESKWGKR